MQRNNTAMQSIIIVIFAVCCYVVPYVIAKQDTLPSIETSSSIVDQSAVQTAINEEHSDATLNRQKRTLLLKKKLIGAGLLGFGLGAIKGYKVGYKTAPQVHHVYLSAPPASVKYVEYIDKPIFIERIIERPTPVFKPIHVEYKDSSPYGPW
ncbi:uncharacterized protein LOC122536133 [Frieseomelitta varia]|nr:uncharacterized protein LOC122536133 [Frieseomelitta varia]XP_043524192.1 uncharacterized protein LOC122536133 [Frieseomelitta varia]